MTRHEETRPIGAQALIFPIAPRAIGVAIALVTTLPIAFRHIHPVAATLVSFLPWAYPTDGYLVLGYVIVLLMLHGLAVQVDDLRVVVAVPAFGLAIGVAGLIRNEEGIGEWLSTFLALSAPGGRRPAGEAGARAHAPDRGRRGAGTDRA